ncbi:hypothetical protein C8R43DRAFT_1174491, partial [Mycena crocata]
SVWVALDRPGADEVHHALICSRRAFTFLSPPLSLPAPLPPFVIPPMRGLYTSHTCLSALFSVIWFSSQAAGQANRTVDDFSPLLTYAPAEAVTHLNTTGFEVPKLYNGTIAVMNGSDSSVNVTMKFTGSAAWLFLAKPLLGGYGTSYTIFVDGVDVNDVGSYDLNDDAEYGVLAWSNDSLGLGPHTVRLMADNGALVYFDYAVFTSNDPTPETTIPPVQPPPSSAFASGAPSQTSKAKNTAHPGSSESAGAADTKPKSHIAAIAGAAGGVVLLLAAGGLVACLVLRKRRREAAGAGGYPQKPTYNQQYATGAPHGSNMPYNAGQQQQAVYNAHSTGSTPYASEAALLRVATQGHGTSVSYNSAGAPSPPFERSPDPFGPQFQGAQVQPQYQQQQQYPNQDPTQFNTQPHPTQYPPQQQTQSHSPYDNLISPYNNNFNNASSHSPSQPHILSPYGRGYSRSQDAEMASVLAEQRAVEAEHARPQPGGWGDEKAAQRVATANLSPSSMSSSSNAQSGSGKGGISPLSPASADSYDGTSPPSRSQGQGELSNIAAEMRALRAQVARLEGGGERGRGHEEEEMPPAYGHAF